MLHSKLKQILDNQDISIRQLAKDIDYRFESVRQLYNDEMERYPRDLLDRLCKHLNITLDQLFTIEEGKKELANE